MSLCVCMCVARVRILFRKYVEGDAFQKKTHSFHSVGGEDSSSEIWTGNVENALLTFLVTMHPLQV